MTDEERNKQNMSMIVGAIQAEVKIFTRQQESFQTTIYQLHGELKKEVTQRIDGTLASLPCSERAERLASVEAKADTNKVIVHELADTVQDHEATLVPIKQERKEAGQAATEDAEEKRGIRVEVKSAIYITAILGLFKLVETVWPLIFDS